MVEQNFKSGHSANGGYRIGVFICHCGGNISDIVDVKRVAAEIAKMPNVVVSETEMFMCSDPGQARIEQSIKDNKLNRVIVAACSPTLHELTFRRACARAGLNPYLFEHVNIREQVSWVIVDKEAATQKALRLIRASVGRVHFLVELEKRKIPIHDSALVIGGGVAGLQSALDLADRGINVTLIEKSGKIGGRLLELDTVFPTDEKASDLIQPLIKSVESNKKITIYKNTELNSSTGSIGDFHVKLDVGTPSGGSKEVEVHAGVIVIAVGLDEYEPRDGEYMYRKTPNVVGLLEYQKMLNPSGPTGGKLVVNGKPVKNVGFIHCVGSRQWADVHQPQADGKVNDYCSRYCCTAIMHSAVETKKRYPDVNVFDFHEDIRTYGRGHEEFYTKASELGVYFFRFDPHKPVQVEKDPKGEAPLVIKCKDRLTVGTEIEVPVDLVVLGTGLMPTDMTSLIDLYRCSRGQDRFLLEAHPKLRPVELAAFGLFLAGSAQGPMDITEATAGAAAAASKAAALVSQGFVELDPFIAKVVDELCTGCQTCMKVCPYDAISRDEVKKIAVVSEALCTGCGTCAATCPSNAIQQFGYNDNEVMSEVLSLLGVIKTEEKELVTAG
jgi:heterodisulfide reductase subunit A2